jgi:hypothetical protein
VLSTLVAQNPTATALGIGGFVKSANALANQVCTDHFRVTSVVALLWQYLEAITMRHRTVCFRSSPQYSPDIFADAFSSVAHHHAF